VDVMTSLREQLQKQSDYSTRPDYQQLKEGLSYMICVRIS